MLKEAAGRRAVKLVDMSRHLGLVGGGGTRQAERAEDKNASRSYLNIAGKQGY